MLRLFRHYYPIRNIFFVLGEGLIIYLAVLFSSRLIMGDEGFAWDRLIGLKALLITAVCQASLYYNDLYDLKIADTFSEIGIRLLQALGFSSIFLAGVYYFFPGTIIQKGVFVVSVGLVILFIVSWRIAYNHVLKEGLFNQKLIILGSGKLARSICDEIAAKKDCGYSVSVMVPEEGQENILCDPNTSVLLKQNYSGLCDLAKKMGINKIVVALQEKRRGFPVQGLLNCRVSGIEVLEGNSFYEILTGKLIVEHINPSWLIFSDGFHQSWFRRTAKRGTDLLFSTLLLIVVSPIIAITALFIKLDSQGPVIFSQDRVGENRKPYQLYKFRSMVADAEKVCGPVWAQADDDRITRVGRFIRKWRVDELPQLWNVLKGDMSFVGPRPEREFFIQQLESQIPYYRERFSVKPGITGWAQVCYPYGASVEDAKEKLNYDLFYLKNMSVFFDLMIVLKTIKTVIFGEGAR
jgi:sugar transferase (PEP-CTERM system associated)